MKTLAIRLDDDVHAQLSVVAQLRDSNITEVIRDAIAPRELSTSLPSQKA